MKKKQSIRHMKQQAVISKCLMNLIVVSYGGAACQTVRWNNYRQKRLISNYEEAVTQAEESIDYEAEWKKAHDYNEALLPSILPDSFAVAAASEEEDEVYMSCLNLAGNGVMGYVEIPKIDIKLPVFHGTDEKVLEQAAGHLEGSSLPVGGVNTHAVISAHRGLPSASLFTDLDRLEEGDHFLLYILDDILCYEVDRVSVVEPEETEGLSVVDGEDLVTLLTCTPYGVNTQRLLVRGSRIPYVPEEAEAYRQTIQMAAISGPGVKLQYIGAAAGAVFLILILMIAAPIRRRRRNREARHAE